MKVRGYLVLSMVLAALLTGCDGDSDGGGGSGASGVAGSWSGSGQYDQGVPINSFNLNLTQNGNAVGGSYSITRPVRGTMTGSINGSIAGNAIQMTMTPHGWAEGSVNGNTMALYWYESGFDGVGGGGNVNLSK